MTAGSVSIRKICTGVILAANMQISDAKYTAGRQITICSFAFAISTSAPSTGNDCIIQRLLPSRDTEGADIMFVDDKRQIIAISSGLMNVSDPEKFSVIKSGKLG